MTIDILHCYSEKPKPRDYVLPSLVHGTTGSIISPGGQGKSMLALLLVHHVACGADLLGLGQFHKGKAVYLSAEDSRDIIHERLYEIGHKLTDTQKEEAAERLIIEDLTTQTPDLLKGDDCQKWRGRVEELAQGARLMILDTLRT